MAEHKYVYVDHDESGDRRVVIRRTGHGHVEVSRPARDHEVIHGLGIDTRAYMAAQDFDHEFVPNERPDYTGCAQCGWGEPVHAEARTHIECDWCGDVNLIDMTNRVRMFELHTPATFELPDGREGTIQMPLCLTRFFCWADCLQAWMDRFAPDE